MKNKKVLFTVRDMTEIALMVAIAILLTFLDIDIGENGGSIGFVMIPLFYVCYRHGFIKGFIASGVVFGIIHCIMGGYGFASYPLDYLLAFGGLAVVSFFYKPIFESENKVMPYVWTAVSIFIACFIRFVSHTISGMILWETPFWGSVVYNAAYVGPSTLLCMIAFCALLPAFKMLNKKFPATRYLQGKNTYSDAE